ncbi:MAG TPA: hypothetical protein VM871_06135 [Flavisolibacter sp.]|jgi:uncharacterized tellurite resistance protein B-like protein|nr:hypothetical protein [Flavisolibacter sp.]
MNETYQRLQNEPEAAVAILFGCLQHSGKQVQNRHLEHLSRMLLLNQKFAHHALQPLAEKVLPLLKSFGSRTVIEHSAPLISEGFRETLFAMVCELMTGDGELNEAESEIVGLTALYLGVSIEMMRIMLATFIMRNRWNV